ncbi:Tyrosine-protein phosphatase non-receptor type 7 isoform 2 [Schistosoma japonicum]|uniref:protein-tyrosine-phosphatase n=2 Tax=Schistosoma japonicum TaxID=6182 RepID=A0A4Z2CN12_SCHJA|nr:Tyrosine-protein phosphatase non-receptor type 7 isoform 2 [Schistosoma japonicum]
MLCILDLSNSSFLSPITVHTYFSNCCSVSKTQGLHILKINHQSITTTLSFSVGIISFILFLLISIFWCIYQKQCRNTSGKKESKNTFDIEETATVDKSGSTVQKDYSSLSDAENIDNLSNSKRPLFELLKLCGISTDCCPIFHVYTKNPNDIVRLNSPNTNQYGTNSLGCVTIESIQEPESLRSDIKKSPVSLSPSIANRRHQTPPPRLLTSSMATSPPVETHLYHIQPKDYVFSQTCKPMPSSLMLQNDSLGTFTVTSTQFLHSPLVLNTSADVLHSHRTPCESQSASCNQTLVTTQPLPLLNPIYCHIACSTSDTITQESNQLSCANTTSYTNSTQVPKTFPGVGFTSSRRARSKGLLESRRGSRTSLTLSLSPSIDSPTPSCSVGSAQFSVFGGSLDEDPCATEILSEKNESGMNADVNKDVSNSNILIGDNNDNYKKLTSRCNYIQSSDSFSHTTVITKYQQQQNVTMLSPLTTSSSICNTETNTQLISDSTNNTQVGLIKKEQYFMNNRCNYMCFHHHHHHHRHHFHHFAIHHCKVDTGFPCSLGNLTCQRNRDLEQLINASLPLTYEQLKTKLRDNSTALFQEFWDIPMNHADKKELPIPGICHKNRYQSILPNFSTRVILPVINNDITSSYINANYIKVKCELYLPDSSGEEDILSFVEDQSFTNSPFFKSSPYTTTDAMNTDDNNANNDSPLFPATTVTTVFIMRNGTLTINTSNGRIGQGQLNNNRCGSEDREVTHFWYVTWPDHSSPEATASVRSLIELVKAVEACRKKVSSSSKLRVSDKSQVSPNNEDINFTYRKMLPDPQYFHGSSYRPKLTPSLQKMESSHQLSESAPIVVHCSAGLGRTGCFIALCIGCEQLEKEGMVDVLKIVSRMRLDRGGMVQSNEQYEFIHHVLAAYPLNGETFINSNHSTCDLQQSG